MIQKTLTIAGVALILIGISAGYVDVATRFRLDFISRDFSLFLLALAVGAVSAFVGVIGWARTANPRARVKMAGVVFAFPIALGALGYPIDGFNIHGPSALLFLLIVPAGILAIVLLAMAGY
jgi:hypothetical protein